MIKMELPFSMGRVTSYNSFTCEETIEHPVLEIGSTFSFLKVEIRQWLMNTGKESKFEYDGNNYCLWFETEQDKIVFILRWL